MDVGNYFLFYIFNIGALGNFPISTMVQQHLYICSSGHKARVICDAASVNCCSNLKSGMRGKIGSISLPVTPPFYEVEFMSNCTGIAINASLNCHISDRGPVIRPVIAEIEKKNFVAKYSTFFGLSKLFMAV